MRNIAISSTEIVCYDVTKHAILKRGVEDGLPVHLASAITAGFAATCVGSPAGELLIRHASVAARCFNTRRQAVFHTLQMLWVPVSSS